jgi:hypothetical protein
MNTSGRATTVQNIFGLNGRNTTYGWIYQTVNQNLYFQRNAADTAAAVGFLNAVLSNVPGIGSALSGLMGATSTPYQITGTQATNIETALQNSGIKVHHCFTAPLLLA